MFTQPLRVIHCSAMECLICQVCKGDATQLLLRDGSSEKLAVEIHQSGHTPKPAPEVKDEPKRQDNQEGDD